MEEPDKLTQTRGSLDIKSSILRRLYAIMCPCFSPHQDKKSHQKNDVDFLASQLSNRSSTKEYELPRKRSLDFTPSLYDKFPYPFLDRELGTGKYTNDENMVQKGHKSRSFVFNLSNSPVKQRETVRETLDLTRELNTMTYTKKKQWYNFPVFKYREGEVIILGRHNKNLLAEISTVKLEPSPTAVQKQLALKMSPQKVQMQKKLQDFWNSRYYYFEKFDELIQIDKESISTLTPEAVSDYIASKCYDCKTALDAFSGIGHNATKLGTLCEKVICVEEEPKKCNMLINNAKCYEIYNIELFMKPFLDISLKQKVDVVLIHPTLINEDYRLSSMSQCKHFRPSLSQVIKKAIQIANNIVLLLPSNISIKQICYEISKSSQQINDRAACSCSVKIQKIYFRNNLSYVAVFFGPHVQQEIKINSELDFIYKWLKSPQEKYFMFKKLIKYLREKYGIIRLLNFISESLSKENQGMTEIEKLVDFIRQRKLIVQHKLQSLLIQEKNTTRKVTIRQNTDEISSTNNSPNDTKIQPFSFKSQLQNQDQQINEEDEAETITQRTQSFYSSGSGISNFKKRRQTVISSMKRTQNQRNETSDHNIEHESNSSSIVVRKILNDECSLQKDSKSPASPMYNPIWRSNINIETSSGQRAYRHTLESKRMENGIFMSAKQNLKKTLIQK